MEANKKRFIRVAGELIEVTKEVYLTYYRGKRREKAQHEKEQYHHVVSFDALDTEGLQGVQMIVNTASPEPEDIVIAKIMCEKLHACMAMLSEDEQALLRMIYFDGLSERDAAQKTGIPLMTLHNKKERILAKLLKLMGG